MSSNKVGSPSLKYSKLTSKRLNLIYLIDMVNWCWMNDRPFTHDALSIFYLFVCLREVIALPFHWQSSNRAIKSFIFRFKYPAILLFFWLKNRCTQRRGLRGKQRFWLLFPSYRWYKYNTKVTTLIRMHGAIVIFSLCRQFTLAL